MARFRIYSHGRLQEWVAEEHGYFQDEGLDYEFVVQAPRTWSAGVQTTESAPPEIVRGAFESFQAGRACEVSSACHWATNMVGAQQHGRMWGHAYAVAPSGIYVAPESPIRTPRDLAGVEIAVGYHSGSHFSTLQALEHLLPPAAINLRFTGLPLDRLRAALDRAVPAAAIWGLQAYVIEQQGFRKVVDTTFMIGFVTPDDVDRADVERYFRALARAQQDIDLEPERYKHYFLRELPAEYHPLADVAAFGPGERIVFAPYTPAMFERTQRWMAARRLFADEQARPASYQEAVLV